MADRNALLKSLGREAERLINSLEFKQDNFIVQVKSIAEDQRKRKKRYLVYYGMANVRQNSL